MLDLPRWGLKIRFQELALKLRDARCSAKAKTQRDQKSSATE